VNPGGPDTASAPPPPVGAVLVVGGGIAGMQASLDLAEAGFKVHLVEALSAIGGKMAQLDKTFPTNDCSMCIVSPKLVEVGRHANIDILTETRLEALDGQVGRFRARLTRRPRYIRTDQCTGCGQCAEVCPVELADGHNLGLSLRRAAFKLYPQAIPGAFAIDKAGRAPCKAACPAHISVQGYVALIAAGRHAEALALIRRDNPFPSVCGRVCPAPCEDACARGGVDEALAIRQLKRFVADYEMRAGPPALEPPAAERPERVAIVGGGPSGLTAAQRLRLAGFGVKVYEAMPRLGGMLRYGIPDYRLPAAVLEREIQGILDLGVEVEHGQRFGVDFDIDSLRAEGYAAVYLATGAWTPSRLRIPGEELAGVEQGIDFLGRVNRGEPAAVGRRVLVIGGGNTAVDAARTALRLGAEQVSLCYRRSREEMPAAAEEIEAAEAEGVELRLLAAPVRCTGDGDRLSAVELQRMELGEPDDSGRRRPVPVAGSEEQLPVDTLIAAIGQWADLDWLPPGSRRGDPEVVARGWEVADPITFATDRPGVFAGGDLASGPASAIEAIAAGKEAAISIERYLEGHDLRAGRDDEPPLAEPEPDGDLPRRARAHPKALSAEARRTCFDEVEGCLTEEQAQAEAKRCLACGVCCECYQCTSACEAGAIDHAMRAEALELEVGSVILAPGYEPFPGAGRPELGYGRYRNVITNLELERLLSASGPSEGHVRRPSDDRAPAKVAFIQCVGSRDSACGRDYCSSVCCMAATKEAVIAREHDGRIEPTVFFIDLRAFGKGFDDYAERARTQHGVHYVRAMVSRVIEDPVSDNLWLRYVDEAGQRQQEEFELVVLSVGLQVPAATRALAERLGVELDRFGFARTAAFDPLATSRPGVFVCGVFREPKDIPETVAEASGAAGAAAGRLAAARNSLVSREALPPERPADPAAGLRIGVFVCHCGINISAIVDVGHLAAAARELPGVVYAEDWLYTCSQDTQDAMRRIIDEQRLNRVVVASCSPRTHEPLFQQTLAQAGLNKYLFEMANIRDQCSWVHRSDSARATAKAGRLLRMAVAKVARAEPLEERSFAVEQSLLVVGGGLAGMCAALAAAEQGFRVTLVERRRELGGCARDLRRGLDGRPVLDFLRALERRLRSHPLVRLHTGSEVVAHAGFVGNFSSEIMTPAGSPRTVAHGATLLATGGRQHRPALYGLGEHERVLTQTDFEQRLHDGAGLQARHVVMIQCAGSRDEARPFCSRVCCNQAIKNAVAFKHRYPQARVDVLYRDVRAYGLAELAYRTARQAGVNFVRYHPDDNPLQVDTGGGRIHVELDDASVGRRLALEPDLLVLSTGIEAAEAEELGTMLRVPRNADGFFIEAHAKLRPVDFAADGVFLAGLAHGPKSIPETMAQASAAVARAATVLAKDELRMSGVVSQVVRPEDCAACLTCVRACPFGVPAVNEDHVAEINAATCQGCGICVAECPGLAIELGHYQSDGLLAKIDALAAAWPGAEGRDHG
jgi:heterodisulfide reductase subunit A-like polyferredoxin